MSYGFLNLRIHMGVIVRVCKRPNGLAIRAPRTRHERYDSCFGYRRSRVRSPVRPTLIFLSLEATLPKRPPYATAEPRGAHIINLPGLISR